MASLIPVQMNKLLDRGLFLVCISMLYLPVALDAQKSSGNKKEYALVWSDEFDYTGTPDTLKWRFDIGDGCPQLCGWGNEELQYYTDRPANARVESGHLVIEARKEQFASSGYTSAKLVTRGIADWTYGRIEVRAKLPSGRGTWPAIWMLSAEQRYGGWPADGEIDIMEHVGFEPNHVYGSVHTKAYNHMDGTQRTAGIMEFEQPFEKHFHVYTIDWNAERIVFMVNEVPYLTFANEQKTYAEWPFDAPFYLILNIAVGGTWGGAEGIDDTIWPQRMEIDYVRVYQ